MRSTARALVLEETIPCGKRIENYAWQSVIKASNTHVPRDETRACVDATRCEALCAVTIQVTVPWKGNGR